MKRRYWVVSPNVSNKPSEESLWKEIITEKHLAFMGWGEDHDFGKKFKNEIKIGDFILIAQGANRQKKLFLGGVVSSEAIWGHYRNTLDPSFNRKLYPYLEKKELEKLELNFKDSAFGDADRIPALYELHPNRNNVDEKIVDKIETALKQKLQKKEMEDKIQLLKYKKQIILQGPPGTGKTRLAKMMAEEMIKSKETLNPLEKIDSFFKSTDTKDPILLERRKIKHQLIESFQKKFPKEHLLEITKEDYALGTGSNDSFCWWIERGLKPLGYYFPGSARSYMLFWKKSLGDYSKHGFVKNAPDFDEAMKRIAIELDKVINQGLYADMSKYFGDGFILKLLNSYYPDDFFPVNSVKCIENALKILNVDYSKLNSIEKNRKLQEIYLQKCKQFDTDITNFEFMHFLFVEFNLKEPVVLDVQSLIKKGKFKVIQFHSSYSYEDFVRGITAKTNTDDKVFYKVEDRILMEFAQEALENPKNNYILILDEINRANLSSVLGELIYALEYRYIFNKDNHDEATVESLYDISNGEDEPNRALMLPENLYIIGTMNTSDRSIGHIDYAIRRRFAFVDVFPTIHPIGEKAKEKFKTVCSLFIENFDEVNWEEPIFKPSKHLSSDFKPEEVMLGHSYFITKERVDDDKIPDETKQIELKLKYEVVPILKEYVKDGILVENDEVKKIINGLVS